MGLDEAGRDQPPAEIELAAVGGKPRLDGGDAALVDADIDRRAAGPAGNAGAAQDQVHGAIPLRLPHRCREFGASSLPLVGRGWGGGRTLANAFRAIRPPSQPSPTRGEAAGPPVACAQLPPPRLGRGGVDREAVVLDPAGEHDAVDVARLADRLPAFQHVVEHARRIARERIAVAAAAAVAPADALALLHVHVDEVRQLGLARRCD